MMKYLSFTEWLLEEGKQEDYYRNLAQRYRDASMREADPYQQKRLEKQAREAETRANAAASRERVRQSLGMDAINQPSPGIPTYREPVPTRPSKATAQPTKPATVPIGSTGRKRQRPVKPFVGGQEIRRGMNLQARGNQIVITINPNSPYFRLIEDPSTKVEGLKRFKRIAKQIVSQHHGIPHEAIADVAMDPSSQTPNQMVLRMQIPPTARTPVVAEPAAIGPKAPTSVANMNFMSPADFYVRYAR